MSMISAEGRPVASDYAPCCGARLLTTLSTTTQPFGKERAYNALAKLHFETHKNIDPGRAVMHDMQQAGVPCFLDTYLALVQQFAAHGDAVGATAVVKEMEAAGVSCNAVIYNTLLQLHIKRREVAAVKQMLLEMKEAGITCTPWVYNSLLKLAIKCKDEKSAQLLMKAMREEGVACVEEQGVYSSLIELGMAMGGEGGRDPKSARAVLEEYELLGIDSDTVALNLSVQVGYPPPPHISLTPPLT
jgi:pentatricopeptide repeat protein